MKATWRAAALGLALWYAQPLTAAETKAADSPEAIFAARVADNSYELTANGTRLNGPALDFLKDAGAKADFFIIGEVHGTADIAQIAHGLLSALAPSGYGLYAMEVGPYSAGYTQRLIGQDKLDAFLSDPETYLALPFLFYREEAALAVAAVEQHEGKGPALWGIDQEFVAGGPIFVTLLSENAETDGERKAVADLREKIRTNPFWLGTAAKEELTDLRAAFEPRGEGFALRLIDALIISHEIYGPFTRREGKVYDANLIRENYFRTKFLEAFRNHDKRVRGPIKVFGKFGAGHAMRGRSLTNVPAFGTFLAEWGASEGRTMFNLLMDCKGGETRDPREGKALPCRSAGLEEGSVLAPLLADIKGPTLIDFKALRADARSWKFLDPLTERLIFAFDAYLAVPNPKPATMWIEPK